ncbi:hypothetical protein ADUPG1_009105 [Aduncisulcus paluster]|uniref:Uncharacterized protein n=1 Tax=Aduncisulcus paluster TaxID=2918883 RepID=A0ABQ5KUE0_9EUKA|nr:hypothetical protein ADUPG1_009105 [Aduncisulcus paluster]
MPISGHQKIDLSSTVPNRAYCKPPMYKTLAKSAPLHVSVPKRSKGCERELFSTVRTRPNTTLYDTRLLRITSTREIKPTRPKTLDDYVVKKVPSGKKCFEKQVLKKASKEDRLSQLPSSACAFDRLSDPHFYQTQRYWRKYQFDTPKTVTEVSFKPNQFPYMSKKADKRLRTFVRCEVVKNMMTK